VDPGRKIRQRSSRGGPARRVGLHNRCIGPACCARGCSNDTRLDRAHSRRLPPRPLVMSVIAAAWEPRLRDGGDGVPSAPLTLRGSQSSHGRPRLQARAANLCRAVHNPHWATTASLTSCPSRDAVYLLQPRFTTLRNSESQHDRSTINCEGCGTGTAEEKLGNPRSRQPAFEPPRCPLEPPEILPTRLRVFGAWRLRTLG
jgi:hypothetical protein